jgi:hypothetical protein
MTVIVGIAPWTIDSDVVQDSPEQPIIGALQEIKMEERDDLFEGREYDGYIEGYDQGEHAGIDRARQEETFEESARTINVPEDVLNVAVKNLIFPKMSDQEKQIYQHGFMRGYREGWKLGYREGLTINEKSQAR